MPADTLYSLLTGQTTVTDAVRHHRRRRHRDRPPRPGAARRSTFQASPRREAPGRSARATPAASHRATGDQHPSGRTVIEIRSKTAGGRAGSVAPCGRPPRPGLLVLATAQLMVVLDATIVNVALPRVQRALGAGTAWNGWSTPTRWPSAGCCCSAADRGPARPPQDVHRQAAAVLRRLLASPGSPAARPSCSRPARCRGGGALVTPYLSLITTPSPRPPRTRALACTP